MRTSHAVGRCRELSPWKPRLAPATRHPQSRRLRLEPLENRHLLTVVLWDGGGGIDQSWHTAANWVGDELPTEDDDVEINVVEDPVIQITEPVTVKSVTADESLVIAAGSLTVTQGDS